MKSLLLSLLILLLSMSSGFASPSPLIDQANELFQQAVDMERKTDAMPLLDKALLRYEQVYRDHPTGKLAYNIGNTYYQMDNRAMALVFYKRAIKELPADSNLLHNMDLVREELQLDATPKQPSGTWLPAYLQPNTSLVLVLYSLFWLALSLRIIKKTMIPIALPTILLFLCLAASTIIGMERLQPTVKEGVIISADTVARQGNGRSFEPSFSDPLPLGTEITILEKRGYWFRIHLGQGEESWVPSRSCEVI